MQKVIVITGPTCVGKTKCSVEVAKRLNSEIINGDAYQIYQKMNIGTAKPSLEEMGNISHHLFDFVSPSETFSVADYQRLVRNKIDELIKRGIVPIIVGGTGLYIDSVISDYNFNAPARDNSNDEKYSDLSNEELYQKLVSLNTELANKIHPNNRKRVLRAIEIAENDSDNIPNNKKELLYDALVIFLNDDRAILYDMIEKRVDDMIKEGLENEVRTLYENHELSSTAQAAIGYKEWIPYFEGKQSKEEVIDSIKKGTRHYAKRQLTWFRNKEYTKEVLIDRSNFDNTINEVIKLIEEFMK